MAGVRGSPWLALQTRLVVAWGWEVSVADGSGVPVWEGDLEVCVCFLLRISFGSGC